MKFVRNVHSKYYTIFHSFTISMLAKQNNSKLHSADKTRDDIYVMAQWSYITPEKAIFLKIQLPV